MKPIYALLSLAFLFCCGFHQAVYAQCPAGQSKLLVHLLTDDYPNETYWKVTDNTGTIILERDPVAGATLYKDSTCVEPGGCYTFTITDSYGDGICCAYGAGYYQVYLDGVLITSGGDFNTNDFYSFNCPPGTICSSGLPATSGNAYTAPANDTWYTFTPDSTGLYTFSTCGLNTCNTVIWIYDHCNGLVWDNTNAATFAYNDDECGLQAEVSVGMVEGTTYYVRIGSAFANCTGPIDWTIAGPFPIYGCMDPMACNYNPLATVDSGGCIAFGSPDCPLAPDLMVVESAFISSMSVGNVPATTCNVQEECLTGFGTRRVINFTTHIKNIGEIDYYIGNPATNPDQFNTVNCHGHPHYEGYAEYLLYDANGTELPIGFKNGFCVIDLECSGGGTAQYGCSNMGITAGCGDIYTTGLSCQWIDITDVDTGRYTMVIRVNWDQSPDAFGRYENNYDNNWAQTCIHIIYDSLGQKTYTMDTTCNPYVDCLGQLYGPAQPDCNGECNGSAKRGDLDANGVLNLFDINGYMSGLLNENLPATPCNDLHADGVITVYDAALLNDCTLYGNAFPVPGAGTQDYCNFPTGIYNFNDTVWFKIAEVNKDDEYVDVYMRNPTCDVNAFEFKVKGLTIENVVNISAVGDYPATPEFLSDGVKVACYSAVDSSLTKSTTYQPLCRIYYSSIGDTVCIDQVIDVVNRLNQKTAHMIDDSACVVLFDFISGIEAGRNIEAVPNPTSGDLNVRFNLPSSAPFTISVVNALGQTMISELHQAALSFNGHLNLSQLPAGSYTLRVQGSSINASRKVIVVR